MPPQSLVVHWYRYKILQGTVLIITEATLLHRSKNKFYAMCVYIYFNNARNNNQNIFICLKFSPEIGLMFNTNKIIFMVKFCLPYAF